MPKREVLFLNGYRLIFAPDHHRAMRNKSGYNGYVYEHVYVASKYLGRELKNNEVIHHLDGDRSNNRHENLLILEHEQHTKLHIWLNKGAPFEKSDGENRVNSGKSTTCTCLACGHMLQDKQEKFCSTECSSRTYRRAERPSKNELQKLINENSWLALGRKFGLSDNAIRKWAKQYGIVKTTLSQASGTPEEGAETTGEVKPS